MTTKPDFNQIQELHEVYAPKARGVVSSQEEQLIKDMLELEQRTVIELRNIRNTTVAFYSRLANSGKGEQNAMKSMLMMGAMSAVTAVIDGMLLKRGAEI